MPLVPNVPWSLPFPIPPACLYSAPPGTAEESCGHTQEGCQRGKGSEGNLRGQTIHTYTCTHTHCIDHDLRQLGCVSTLVVDMYTAYMYNLCILMCNARLNNAIESMRYCYLMSYK